MKRNEKILVYAITGFLALVLVIAVVFGNDKLDTPNRSLKLAEMQSLPEGPSGAGGDGIGADLGSDANSTGKGADAAEASSSGAGGVDPAVPAAGSAGPLVIVPQSLNVSGEMPVADQALPADRVQRMFGDSEKVNNYRRVIVRRGDSLGMLAQRWCGSAKPSVLRDVRMLNEGIDMDDLNVGEPVLLPWVEDQELLDAYDADRAARLSGVVSEPVPASDGGTQPYVVKEGDSAWRIAAQHVDANQVPNFIQEMGRLNPNVASMDSLRVGQKLMLPKR